MADRFARVFDLGQNGFFLLQDASSHLDVASSYIDAHGARFQTNENKSKLRVEHLASLKKTMAKPVEELLVWLPTIAIFGGLEPPSLARIISMLGEHHFKPGTEVCTQGEAGRAMFLVYSGEVLVCRSGEAGHRVKMVRMGPGEFFGEMTLIDIQKRSATVVVEKPAVIYSLSNRDLYQLYQDDVPGYVMVLQNLCRELSRRLRKTNQRLQTIAEENNEIERTLLHPLVKRI